MAYIEIKIRLAGEAGVAYAGIDGTYEGAEAVACLGTDDKTLVVELGEVVGLVGTSDTQQYVLVLEYVVL